MTQNKYNLQEITSHEQSSLCAPYIEPLPPPSVNPADYYQTVLVAAPHTTAIHKVPHEQTFLSPTYDDACAGLASCILQLLQDYKSGQIFLRIIHVKDEINEQLCSVTLVI